MAPLLRTRIGVDIDEVLTPFLPNMIKWSKRKPAVLGVSKYPYVYRSIFGVSHEEGQKILYDFYKSQEFKNLPVIEKSQDCLLELKDKGYEIYAVTGRQSFIRNDTEEWLEKNYPGIFSDLFMTDSFTSKEVSKSSVCIGMNIGSIIDDNMLTCLQCARHDITPINFIGEPVYPWCFPNEYSAMTWRDVVNKL